MMDYNLEYSPVTMDGKDGNGLKLEKIGAISSKTSSRNSCDKGFWAA